MRSIGLFKRKIMASYVAAFHSTKRESTMSECECENLASVPSDLVTNGAWINKFGNKFVTFSRRIQRILVTLNGHLERSLPKDEFSDRTMR